MASLSCWLVVGGMPIGPALAQETSDSADRAVEPSGENSTKKLRVRPSRVASQIGSAVQWRASLSEAEEESRQTGRPVFWYVHSVSGTFMDRQQEIDRYLMAGPFSWPKIIEVLNRQFVPVRAAAEEEMQRRHDLVPYRFIEPGFLVLSPQGEVLAKVDRVTTLHPAWLLFSIRSAIQEEVQPEAIWDLPSDAAVMVAWRQFLANPDKKSVTQFPSLADLADAEDQQLQGRLMLGMLQYYAGRTAEAQETWKQAAQAYPHHPLGWKAAAEREGFGPFVRGFEVLGDLPESAWRAGRESAGSAAGLDTYANQELWQRSVDFLMAMQRDDGGWIDSDYDFGGTDSLPNVYVAVTSLAGLALMEAVQRLPEQSEALEAAIQRAANYVRDDRHINRADRDEILWAYAYRLRFLAARYRQQREELATVEHAVRCLESVQGNRGGWYHEYNNPFVTATALLALHDAQQVGAAVNQQIVQRGVESLLRDRYANGAFPYHSVRGTRSNTTEEGNLAAAAGRMPLCELALLRWGHSDPQRLSFAVTQSLVHHDKLSAGYKYDDHTSTLAYGGFFFWYDMQSRSEAILQLSDDHQRVAAAGQQRDLIRALPELDGCFVDSHELGRCYGTAMALLSMALVDQVSNPRPAEPGSAGPGQ